MTRRPSLLPEIVLGFALLVALVLISQYVLGWWWIK